MGAEKLRSFSDTANLDSSIIAQSVLGVSDLYILSNAEKLISNAQLKQFLSLVNDRVMGKPIAYITGKKEFWGMEFCVSSATLIPRPDSETIIYAVQDGFLHKDRDLFLLDVGSGSGCLLCAVLSEYVNANGVGLEKSPEACQIATKNVLMQGFFDRGRVIQFDWKAPDAFECLCQIFDLSSVDCIVCNPPYVLSRECDFIPFEPKLALDGGSNGLENYEIIGRLFMPFLRINGFLLYEVGIGQHEFVKDISLSLGYSFVDFYTDLAGIKRVVGLRKP